MCYDKHKGERIMLSDQLEYDEHDIHILRHGSRYYLPIDLAPGINPLDWADISRRIGRLDPETFSYLKQKIERRVF